MNDQMIRDLLHEAADDIEPGDRLDAIRAATAKSGRRTHRGWWAAGGAGLVAASVVTALALTTSGAPQDSAPQPAEPAPTRPTTITDGPRPGNVMGGVPVYYVGDTPDGPALYRENRYVDVGYGKTPLTGVIGFALGRARDGAPAQPLDPDYRVLWPADAYGTATLDDETGEIGVTVGSTAGRSAALRERGDLSPEEAALAVEALIRTAQGAVGRDAPVRFSIDGTITDQLLGVPTSEPLTAGSDLDVLAHVNLLEPAEGLEIRAGEALNIDGLGLSEGGQVSLQVRRWEGTAVVVDARSSLSPPESTGLPQFSVGFIDPRLTPGDYEVIATVTNPDGSVDTDTRRITIVD